MIKSPTKQSVLFIKAICCYYIQFHTEEKIAPLNAAAAGILFAPPPPIPAGRRAADPNHPKRRRRQNIIGAGL
jgi:hypothetical protein